MKISIANFLPRRPKKLRASTRRPLRIAASANYDEMAEPNMKLSRALLIVLVLHVVAVSGIIAFNALKTRQGSPSSAVRSVTNKAAVAPATKSDPSVSHPSPPAKEIQREDPKAEHSFAKSPIKSERKTEAVKSAGTMAALESGKVYVVAKGDNPVSIAKKFKVSYDDLLAINHIDDPRKLKVGQKLLIPNKSTKAKKTEE